LCWIIILSWDSIKYFQKVFFTYLALLDADKGKDANGVRVVSRCKKSTSYQVKLGVGLILAGSVFVQLGGCRSSKPNEPKSVFWEHPITILEDCGFQGSIVFRLNDCRKKNVFLSQHIALGHKARWQLVYFNRHYFVSLWLESMSGTIWSSPLAYNAAGCDEVLPELSSFNEAKLNYRLANLTEYRQIFNYGFPAPLQERRARYFIHADFEKTGMIVDEKTLQLRNPLDEQAYWVRCVTNL